MTDAGFCSRAAADRTRHRRGTQSTKNRLTRLLKIIRQRTSTWRQLARPPQAVANCRQIGYSAIVALALPAASGLLACAAFL